MLESAQRVCAGTLAFALESSWATAPISGSLHELVKLLPLDTCRGCSGVANPLWNRLRRPRGWSWNRGTFSAGDW